MNDTTITLQGWLGSDVTLRQADVFLDNGALNEPERHLIRGTTLQYLIDAVDPNALADQHRQRIEAGLDYVDQVAGRLAGGSPTFAFLHVPSPHIPVVMDASGGLLAVASIVLSGLAMGFGLLLQLDARPARVGPAAMLLALVAARMSRRYQSLALKAALFAAVAWVIGMTVAIVTDGPLL